MDWKVLLSTFALLFVAELGDKTQLAVISMTCKHGKPWPVFIGATLALALVTLLGVMGGRAVSYVIPASVLTKVAAAAFVVLGVLMWFEVL
ncbi:MAG: TMEM165/GDT1 family protein [Anaerolineae bacterium]|jgi:putative Ca2+/H+ antiporter (TMEM165/GDT1 family)|nr:TMEM165/GDT1 family protein [Anaerolineae bacterium]MDH7473587.1 TMEM165/GDT1 family protein [Anaerolineae bacterium]